MFMQDHQDHRLLTALGEGKHGHAEAVTFKPLAQLVVASEEGAQLLREVNVGLFMLFRSWGI